MTAEDKNTRLKSNMTSEARTLTAGHACDGAARNDGRVFRNQSERASRLFDLFALIRSGRSGRVRDGPHSLIGEGWLIISHFDEAKFNQCHQIVLADGRQFRSLASDIA